MTKPNACYPHMGSDEHGRPAFNAGDLIDIDCRLCGHSGYLHSYTRACAACELLETHKPEPAVTTSQPPN